ncbi:SDR family NAD(P)-dependent oxidoreductase [Crystallibacter degradans]|uniref:SDR family NAD(P)-dependent oxidoreductase n=1 Tax=Crystallibacter degradans TaxID=2726743 RepID=UPI001475E31E|nr:SDR family oxidoreductase [Arthrobacter sp. SF27]NMR32086.1 SDR family oxidoreductase [Arthrobacter sp. SF27]
MNGKLDGLRVLVTGAAGGIGTAVVDAAIAEGAAAVIVADVTSERVATAVGRLRQPELDVFGIALDVSDEASWHGAMKEVSSTLGGLDVLVNNAGVTNRAGVLDTRVEDWSRVIAVNQTGVFLGMKHATPVMRDSGGGAVVNICSFAAFTGYEAAAYTASKWAVRGLSKAAANELAPAGIRVNTVCPGFVETPLTQDAPALVQSFSSLAPIGRACQPREIADGVVFLASEASSYITGHDLLIDGGYMASATRFLQA